MLKFEHHHDAACPHCAVVQAINTWIRHTAGGHEYLRGLREAVGEKVAHLTDRQLLLAGIVQSLGTMLGEALLAETDDRSGERQAQLLHLFNQALGAEVDCQAVVAVPNAMPGGSEPGTRH